MNQNKYILTNPQHHDHHNNPFLDFKMSRGHYESTSRWHMRGRRCSLKSFLDRRFSAIDTFHGQMDYDFLCLGIIFFQFSIHTRHTRYHNVYFELFISAMRSNNTLRQGFTNWILGTSLRSSRWCYKELIFNENETLSIFNKMNICLKYRIWKRSLRAISTNQIFRRIRCFGQSNSSKRLIVRKIRSIAKHDLLTNQIHRPIRNRLTIDLSNASWPCSTRSDDLALSWNI